MANDINKAISTNPIKNGTSVMSCTRTGEYSVLNTNVKNTPTISEIEDKYDNRFYNGIFVQLTSGQTIIGA
jgi:hypothetical protein